MFTLTGHTRHYTNSKCLLSGSDEEEREISLTYIHI